jgi:RimJ/RimL family protein N-acetyltransferase
MVRLALGSAAQAGEVDLRGTADWLSASPYIEDMPAAQAWADLAVSAAGSTVYELMRMGVPSIVVSVAENQRATARALGELGIAVDLGGVESLEPEAIEHAVEGLAADRAARLRMSERGRVAVDGQGALRVRKAMQTRALTLRPARDEDVKQIWEWANEPETRAVSFSTSLIPWEDHVRWFATHMEEANHRMFIAETADGKPVGIVRFELAGDHAVISVGIDHAMRNGGFGRWLIHLGSREALQSVGVRVVYAYIKPDNAASVQAFESAGFQLHSRSAVRGQDALLFTLARCGS